MEALVRRRYLFFVACAWCCNIVAAAAQTLSLLAPLSSVVRASNLGWSLSTVDLSASSVSSCFFHASASTSLSFSYSSFSSAPVSHKPPVMSTDDFVDTCFSFASIYDDDDAVAGKDDDDDLGNQGDDTTPGFQLEVDTTILNESVVTFSVMKQTNLRVAFAVLLHVSSSDVAIVAITDVHSPQPVRALMSAAVNVVLGVQFPTGTDVQQALGAVVAMFADGTLAAYMERMGTPLQMTLNNVRIQDDHEELEAGDDEGYSDPDDPATPAKESKASKPPIVAGAVGGTAGFVILVVLFVKRGSIAPHVFTRVVPSMQ